MEFKRIEQRGAKYSRRVRCPRSSCTGASKCRNHPYQLARGFLHRHRHSPTAERASRRQDLALGQGFVSFLFSAWRSNWRYRSEAVGRGSGYLKISRASSREWTIHSTALLPVTVMPSWRVSWQLVVSLRQEIGRREFRVHAFQSGSVAIVSWYVT